MANIISGVKNKVSRLLIPLGDPNRFDGSAKVGYVRKLNDYFETCKQRMVQPNPMDPNRADIVNWQLWDQYAAAAAATTVVNINLFTIPIGGAGKTKRQTNLDQVARLPDPEWMNVTGIGFEFASDTIKVDVDGFLAAYYAEFWVSQKVYVEGPLQVFQAGTGLYGVTTQQNVGTWVNGKPDGRPGYDLRLPAGISLGAQGMTDGLTGITILQGQNFKVVLTAAAGVVLGIAAAPVFGTGITVTCYLFGIKSRGVQ